MVMILWKSGRLARPVALGVLALLALGLAAPLAGCRPATPPEVAGGPGQGTPGSDQPSGSDQTSPVAERSLEGLSADLAAGYALAFAAPNPDENAGYTIYVSVPWTAEPVVLDTDTSGEFAWAPDGEHVLYLRQSGGAGESFTLLLGTLDGSPATVVATFPGYPDAALHTPRFSPDGRFLTMEDGTSVACVLRVFTSGAEELSTVGIYGSYVWSPDGSCLAYGGQESVDPPLPIGDGYSCSLRILDPVTGEDRLLLKGDSDYMYNPSAWPAADKLVYSRTSVGKAPDWQQEVDYFSLDPTAAAPEPVPAEAPAGLLPRNTEQLIPAELREAWTGLFLESPDGSAVLFATHLQDYPWYVLRVLDLETGACGVIGAGGLAAWSPVPVAGP